MDQPQFDIAAAMAQGRSFLAAAALAVLGGVVRALRSSHCTGKQLVVEFLTSLFSGIIVWLILHDTPIGEYYRAGVVGVCGYVAPKILDYFSAKACNYMALDGEKPK